MALDLLWGSDVDPNKVFFGLAFYGRTFSMTSPTCNTAGYTYESGGQAGRCSKEVGIIMNSEIDELVEKNGIALFLYKKEAANVALWGSQWVAYDDEETEDEALLRYQLIISLGSDSSSHIALARSLTSIYTVAS